MEQTNQAPSIEREETRLIVPYAAGKLTFIYPPPSPNTYQEVGKSLLKRGLALPNGDQTAALLHTAFCVPEVYDEPEFQDIIDIMRVQWLWVFQINRWTDKGVYVVHDQQAIGRSMPLAEDNLEQRLADGAEIHGVRFSKDNTVRFAPTATYQLGEHKTRKSLIGDGFMIASFGETGAAQVAEVAGRCELNPYVWGVIVEKGKTPEQRVAAGGESHGGGRLDIGGNYAESGWVGHAFGVRRVQ